METLIKTLRPLLEILYQFHDWASDFLAKHIFTLKRIILVCAHLALFGFLFPELRKGFGEVAANLLIAILFLSPLSKIFRMRLLIQGMMLRREFGIMMAYLATVHGVGYLMDPDWAEFILGPLREGSLLGNDPRYLFGLAAYLLTLPLLLTSNALSQKLMGAKWKLLHRTVYVMFIFAILHRFTIRGMSPSALLQAFVLIGAYASLKLLAWKNFIPFLVNTIRLIAEDYRRFRLPPVAPAAVPTDAAHGPQA
ncbi:MAG: ferric reductase-like transmembrane domain-containing protein [Undibacterium sp.]